MDLNPESSFLESNFLIGFFILLTFEKQRGAIDIPRGIV
jgi:hypothetical protein